MAMETIEIHAGYLYEYLRAYFIHTKLIELPSSQQNIRQQGINTIIERMEQYANEVSRESNKKEVNSAWLRGFNEGRLAHPLISREREEQKEQQCTCGGFPDCICKIQEKQK